MTPKEAEEIIKQSKHNISYWKAKDADFAKGFLEGYHSRDEEVKELKDAQKIAIDIIESLWDGTEKPGWVAVTVLKEALSKREAIK